ncbi:hypothetical protein [Marinobacter bohaiensis]|uniref:hypothetical protein n=1 Tax=Marinobacter bohaiensis TaxID=2201898 RepID=UPI0013A6B61D|nr:hypothetical protein [Marinobacter bohaiensis]
MFKWTLIFVLMLGSASVNAALISYEISNELTDLDTGEESTAAMEAVFDDSKNALMLLDISFGSKVWRFESEIGQHVTFSTNDLGGLYEIFLFFDPVTLVNGSETALFSVSEWKVASGNPGIEVLRNLGTSGPAGLGMLQLGGHQYGVTSYFDNLIITEVVEPTSLSLTLGGLLCCVLVAVPMRRKRVTAQASGQVY